MRAFNELLAWREAKIADLEKRSKKLAGHHRAAAEGRTETKGSAFAK